MGSKRLVPHAYLNGFLTLFVSSLPPSSTQLIFSLPSELLITEISASVSLCFLFFFALLSLSKMSADTALSSFIFSPAFHSSTVLNLEIVVFSLLFLAVFAFWLTPGGLAWALSKSKTRAKAAIPGPSGFPLLGLVLAFTGSLTHRVLDDLSKRFRATGLMAFSVGFTRFIISSQPETAKEILNSSAFADRPVKESAYELLFHRAMGFAPYGDYWRNLRRISATYLFSPRRIASFGEFRREIGLKMVREIMGSMESKGVVEVKKLLHFGSLNNVMMSVFGRCYDFSGGQTENADATELEALVSEGYQLLGIFNWSDHFPVLGWLDMQGVRRRCRDLVGRVNVYVGKIIEEHRLKRALNGGEKNPDDDGSSGDFVDVLLDLEKENRLTDSDMIAVLWVYSLSFFSHFPLSLFSLKINSMLFTCFYYQC